MHDILHCLSLLSKNAIHSLVLRVYWHVAGFEKLQGTFWTWEALRDLSNSLTPVYSFFIGIREFHCAVFIMYMLSRYSASLPSLVHLENWLGSISFICLFALHLFLPLHLIFIPPSACLYFYFTILPADYSPLHTLLFPRKIKTTFLLSYFRIQVDRGTQCTRVWFNVCPAISRAPRVSPQIFSLAHQIKRTLLIFSFSNGTR